MWIGIDDTDSPKGMCTTYLATLIIERLEKLNIKLIGYPRLIRLNPTIPFKTRGNGAVSFLVELPDESRMDELISIVQEMTERYAELKDEKTNPGVVFVEDDKKSNLSTFALKVVRDVDRLMRHCF